MIQHPVLSRWAISVEEYSGEIRLFLSLTESKDLPEKSFVISYTLLDQNENALKEKLDNIPVAFASSIKGKNFNYIDGSTKRFHGLLELRSFIAPKTAEHVIIEMRRWNFGDKDPGTLELLSAIEGPSSIFPLLKKIPKIPVNEETENA